MLDFIVTKDTEDAVELKKRLIKKQEDLEKIITDSKENSTNKQIAELLLNFIKNSLEKSEKNANAFIPQNCTQYNAGVAFFQKLLARINSSPENQEKYKDYLENLSSYARHYKTLIGEETNTAIWLAQNNANEIKKGIRKLVPTEYGVGILRFNSGSKELTFVSPMTADPVSKEKINELIPGNPQIIPLNIDLAHWIYLVKKDDKLIVFDPYGVNGPKRAEVLTKLESIFSKENIIANKVDLQGEGNVVECGFFYYLTSGIASELAENIDCILNPVDLDEQLTEAFTGSVSDEYKEFNSLTSFRVTDFLNNQEAIREEKKRIDEHTRKAGRKDTKHDPKAQITDIAPIVLELTEPKVSTPPGYPMMWDLATKGFTGETAILLARNIGQMVREKNNAGFLLLQSVPTDPKLRKLFIDTLNEALSNGNEDTGWRIAEKQSDTESDAVITLYNSALYDLMPRPELKNDFDEPELNENCDAKQLHWFTAKGKRKDVTSPLIVANLHYKKEANSEIFRGDFKSISKSYAVEGNYETKFEDGIEIFLGGHIAEKKRSVDSSAYELHVSNKFFQVYSYEHYSLKEKPDFNHPNTAVYHLSDTEWDSQEITKVLEKQFVHFTTDNSQKLPNNAIKTEKDKQRRLSLFTDPFPIATLLAGEDSKDYEFKNRLIDLIKLLRNSTPSGGWNKDNVPQEIRLVIPVHWPVSKPEPDKPAIGHFSPLCLTLKIKPDELAQLLNSKAPPKADDLKPCIDKFDAKLYESTTRSDLKKDVNGKSEGIAEDQQVGKKLNTLLSSLFAEGIEVKDSVPILQAGKHVDDIGKGCGVLTAFHAENFLKGSDEPVELDWPEDVELEDKETHTQRLRDWHDNKKWDDEQRKCYSEASRRFILEQRRRYAVEYDAGFPEETPEKTEEEKEESKSKSDPKAKTKAELWNEQRKKFDATRTIDYLRLYKEFLETHDMKETGNKVIKGLPASNENAVFEFQKSKEGGMEITLQGKTTEEKIEAMLLKHLANGHDPERDQLVITTSRPGLYLPFLEKYQFKNVSFSNAPSAEPASAPPQDLASMMKGMGI